MSGRGPYSGTKRLAVTKDAWRHYGQIVQSKRPELMEKFTKLLEESVKMTGYGIPGKDDDRRGPSYNTTGIMPRGKAPEDLRCWNCDGFGHYTDQCTEPLCDCDPIEMFLCKEVANQMRKLLKIS
ncbi:hypothetical protein ADUPG1_004974 [Aduncisulcus paluster]|uniref:CCHC-type domain-containing protein n=1 Tax=Aduncisulcus paluster TaxID=2918883 RepID=A0ABQ5K7M6_9EUKA|nr:hypothetical protein ADUPG1_004974 [Aduncisulcus paluster]